jgi:hypothetical protein
MGRYDGGHAPVDSSSWDQPVSSIKDGEPHPEPARSRNGQREVTPDPYTQDSPHVKRNFGKQ